MYRGADKTLAWPGRKQARKQVRDARDFNNIEPRTVIKLFLLQGKAPKEINAILTETLACFLPARVRDLSAPLYVKSNADERFSFANVTFELQKILNFRVCTFSFRYTSCNAHAPYCYLWPIIFFPYQINSTIFEKKIYWTQNVCFDFL